MDKASHDAAESRSEFSIEYLRKKPSTNMPENHFHDFYEIYYQVSGRRHYFINDKVYDLNQGDIIFINTFDLHKTTSLDTPNYSRILVHFSKSFLAEFLESVGDIDLFYGFEHNMNFISPSPAFQVKLENILKEMLEEDETRSPGYLTGIKIRLISLLVYYSRQSMKGGLSYGDSLNVMHGKMSQAAKYVSSRFYSKITLEGISKQFAMSSFYFCRVFKRATGFTLIEYVNAVRVIQACRLLRETDSSITDIAGQCGFESDTHFGRVFKGIMYVSASQYRREANSI
jgi:AraC-like DNA-binding protein